jgi:myo-inositol-1(or 4)-monophosphatase
MNFIDEFQRFAKHLADESAKVIKPYFRTKINIEQKSDLSPVTIADKKAEEVLREIIKKEFPSHGIIGEEFGTENEDAEFVWVLDPIDGTKSFISGALSFGTLIALLHKNKPVLGVINHPILNEFLIGDNFTTYLNEHKVSVRNISEISQATLIVTDHLNAVDYLGKEKFETIIRKVKIYRNWGDCYGYYLLSTGFVDIMIDSIMSIWDKMALIPIVRGSGGIITDCNGNEPESGTSILAATPKLYKPVLEILTLN